MALAAFKQVHAPFQPGADRLRAVGGGLARRGGPAGVQVLLQGLVVGAEPPGAVRGLHREAGGFQFRRRDRAAVRAQRLAKSFPAALVLVDQAHHLLVAGDRRLPGDMAVVAERDQASGPGFPQAPGEPLQPFPRHQIEQGRAGDQIDAVDRQRVFAQIGFPGGDVEGEWRLGPARHLQARILVDHAVAARVGPGADAPRHLGQQAAVGVQQGPLLVPAVRPG